MAVVRNLTLDWLRVRDGRRRLTVPAGLSQLQQEIYAAVCIDGYSPVEAYERISARHASAIPFHLFLRAHELWPGPRVLLFAAPR